MTQVGQNIRHSMRLTETNAMTPNPRLYLIWISSYWQKKLLVTSSDLDDLWRGQRRKNSLEVSINTIMVRFHSYNLKIKRQTGSLIFVH